MNACCKFNIYMLMFIPQNPNICLFIYYSYKNKNIYFFQKSAKYVLALRRHMGCEPYSCYFLLVLSLTRLLIVISVRSGFIYLLMLICGSFTLGRLFDSILAHLWFNQVLYFSLKNLFSRKVF